MAIYLKSFNEDKFKEYYHSPRYSELKRRAEKFAKMHKPSLADSDIPYVAYTACVELAREKYELLDSIHDEYDAIKYLDEIKERQFPDSIRKYSDKSWGLCLILCFFLGLFGIHRFYVGKRTSGIIYLFTIGIVSWGWIYDLYCLFKGEFTDSEGNHLEFFS